jgi:hypothetical protein
MYYEPKRGFFFNIPKISLSLFIIASKKFAMAWETFDGFAFETRIMIRKIAIRHVDKHH